MPQTYHKIKTDKLSMRNNMEDNIWPIKWLDPLSPQWSRQSVITVSRHDLDDHEHKKWSRHRSFLYRCDRSPGAYVLKLGTEIPN